SGVASKARGVSKCGTTTSVSPLGDDSPSGLVCRQCPICPRFNTAACSSRAGMKPGSWRMSPFCEKTSSRSCSGPSWPRRAESADVVEEMTADERRAVFEQLDIETAAETLSEIEPEMQASIVADLDEERAADILEEMDPDEATDLLQDLPEERREELIDLMQKEEAQDVEELLTYPEDSAGGIMTSDFLALPAEMTAAQAIDLLREKKPDPALTYYLYVVDPQEKLEGVLSLRDLVVAPPETKVTAIMDPNILKVSAETPKEDVASLIAKYDL